MAATRIGGGSGSNTTTTTEVVEPKVAVDTNGDLFKVPDYTIKEVLGAIPPECYERNLVVSMYYVLRDIFFMVCIGYLAQEVLYEKYISDRHMVVRFSFWFLYTVLQGLFGTGLWVLAHECGHGAFSDYKSVNDFVGWVLHSFLLVPYFSWKFSHSKHHKATGHLTKDMVFLPPTAEEFKVRRGFMGDLAEHSGDSPVRTLLGLIGQQLGGWHAYVVANVTGQTYPNASKWTTNHFWPYSPLFEARDAFHIVLSDLGILTQLLVLRVWYLNYGAWSLFIHWVGMWLWVNHWLVFITYLQHTDVTLPHYASSEWTFAKGAACTIDRKFGFIGPYFFHDIIETHVLHHYCSRIPFYNARKATAAIRKVMGEHYRSSDENMWLTLWKTARSCQFVDDETTKGVYMYRNVNGKGVGARVSGKKYQ
ncbi:uncharacterized protein Ecym_2769 [Eremothecium cymbalariae DBVPG|uniref:Fatty acid desaturase domain-containing protein n=1 Tax=Eremothecium cymbalariae (strain CBS 270.75 / DBVPG 7215 / KCTC 17166 / NRRL Y-17582) TaxID=931890 RepID=G8JQ05_ERECY|nr:Hypothetical protein Ecym_2769 [Eremothecium cymbalariae DBVPG\